MEPTVVKVEIDGDNIDIRYSDGSRERIEFGTYELRDSDGKRVERHRASDDDYARLQDIAATFDGDTASDDGTPDQGPGDAAGTEGADDSPAPGDDDGTPDQGPGDAPGAEGADDGPTPGDDDGTPDQGPGDAPGTEGADDSPTPGDDDGTPDQGPGDGTGDGTGDGAGDGGDDAGSGLVLIEGTEEGERIRGTRADEEINGNGGDDRLEGRSGDDVINGGDGADEVRGDRGNDVLNGGAGNDDLWGDAGADSFVFEPGTGSDKIHDFEPGIDLIDVSAYGFAGAGEVLAGAWQDGDDTFVDLGGGDVIKIDDIALAQLSDGDFIV